MKSYESMFLIKPDLGKDDLDKVLNQIQELIVKHKGSVDKVNDLGKKKTAYPVKKFQEGFYYLINMTIEQEEISKLKRGFGLNESILRVLVTAI